MSWYLSRCGFWLRELGYRRRKSCEFERGVGGFDEVVGNDIPMLEISRFKDLGPSNAQVRIGSLLRAVQSVLAESDYLFPISALQVLIADSVAATVHGDALRKTMVVLLRSSSNRLTSDVSAT